MMVLLQKIGLPTLIGVAATGGMVIGISGIHFYRKTQAKIRKSEFYSEALDVLYKNVQAQNALGTPIKILNIDVRSSSSSSKNLKSNDCRLTIPVLGTNDKGNLYLKGVLIGDVNDKKCKLTHLDLRLDFAQKTFELYENKNL